MVASKGGISYETVLKMTRREAREITYALALAHGADIDWETGEIKPPVAVQTAISNHVAATASQPGTMRFHI